MRSTGLFTPALLCALLCSCTTFREAADIDVALVDVHLGQATVWETTALFTVRVSNETPAPLIIDGSVHKFYLNGQYIGAGLSDERLEVPRLSSTTQAIPVHLRNLAVATRIKPILESRAVDYRVSSTLYLVEGRRTHRCRLMHDGRLALQDFQPQLQSDTQHP